jgi:glycosyltransferase involved in cell wall biosynthesis
MKILFLTNHLNGDDGWSRYSVDFIGEIQNLRNEVLVLTYRNSYQNEIKELPILLDPIKYLANPINSFLTAQKIKKIIKDFSPDIVHFMVEPYVTILPFLGRIKAKTFITIHGTYSVVPILFSNFFKKTFLKSIYKRCYDKVNGVIAVSCFTKNHILKYFPQIETKTKVITNGINLNVHKIINHTPKKRSNKIKKILFVGAIKQRKGILESIEACKYYRDHFSTDFIYDIVGNYNENSNYYQQVIKKIKNYGLENKILFHGKISDKDLEEYYLSADLFMMLSINDNANFEGFGLVFLEANAKGVPCIGSKNCGAQEAILDGKTGYVVDPYNPKEVAEKMDLILNKNSIKREDCLNWAKQNDIKIKTKELIEFYNSI